MQENQHSKDRMSLNLDKVLVADPYEKQETPVTVDTSIYMSSAFKSLG